MYSLHTLFYYPYIVTRAHLQLRITYILALPFPQSARVVLENVLPDILL